MVRENSWLGSYLIFSIISSHTLSTLASYPSVPLWRVHSVSGIHSPSLSHEEPLYLLLGSVQMSLPLLISRFIPWPICPSELGTFSLALTFSEVAQSCPTLSDPTDCSLPGSSVHRIFQAIVLEWIAISFSRGSSQPRDWTRISRIVDRRFTIWPMAFASSLNLWEYTYL